jgi:hypothetical protein
VPDDVHPVGTANGALVVPLAQYTDVPAAGAPVSKLPLTTRFPACVPTCGPESIEIDARADVVNISAQTPAAVMTCLFISFSTKP